MLILFSQDKRYGKHKETSFAARYYAGTTRIPYERLKEQTMNQTENNKQFSLIEVRLDIPIAASPDAVWKTLTEEPDLWWHSSHRIMEPPQQMVFEAFPGGRLYEKNGKGEGLLWYHVLTIQPPKRLSLSGSMIPPYGGPATSYLNIELQTTEKGASLLKIHDTIHGLVSEEFKNETFAGWNEIFNEGLKPYIES